MQKNNTKEVWPIEFKLTKDFATLMDKNDKLRKFRSRFILPQNKIYLGANTLGPSTYKASQIANRVINNEWAKNVIGGWNECDWINLSKKLGVKISDLIGVKRQYVIVDDSTTINLYKAIHAAASINSKRKYILTEKSNFPTDLYVISNIAKKLGFKVKAVSRQNLINKIDDETAIVTATEVDYVTSHKLNIKLISKQAQKFGAITVWDLSHSIGVLPLELDSWGVDFAIGCTYKYISGGPGSPSFFYASKNTITKSEPVIPGWFSHRNPFSFDKKYIPSKNINRFLCGTPPILSLAILEGGLDAILDVEIMEVRNKSMLLTSYFIYLIEKLFLKEEISITSPKSAESRGGHVALDHKNSYQIMQNLINLGVVGDFRPPSTMRFGFGPLYTRFIDVWKTANILKKIIETKSWKNKKFLTKKAVT